MEKSKSIRKITFAVAALLGLGASIGVAALTSSSEVHEVKADSVYHYMGWDESVKGLVQMEVPQAQVTSVSAAERTLGVEGETKWYIVDSDVNAMIASNEYYTISGTVNLILEDGHTFTAIADNCEVMRVNENATLNVYGQSLGTGGLNFTTTGFGSAIYNHSNVQDMRISIYGGTNTIVGHSIAIANLIVDLYGGHTNASCTDCVLSAINWSVNAKGGTLLVNSNKTSKPAVKGKILAEEGLEIKVLKSEDGTNWVEAELVDDKCTDWQIKISAKAVMDGSGADYNPYNITNKAQFLRFLDILNGNNGETYNDNAYADLHVDVDLGGTDYANWTPIENYSGELNGKDHTISGLYMNGSNEYLGFVRRLATGGTIEGLTFKGEFSSDHLDSKAGGIASINDGKIKNCINEIAITGKAVVGGIAGVNYSTITHCANKARLVGLTNNEAPCVGGIAGKHNDYVGYFPPSIENCYNLGTITSAYKAGGIAGETYTTVDNNSPKIKYSHNYGSVTGAANLTGAIDGTDYGQQVIRLTSNYYLDTSCDQGIGSGDFGDVTSLTAAQYVDKANFTEWDFNAIWGIDTGLGCPVFSTSYGVFVGGIYVTNFNTSGVGWSYDLDTNTLTLNNYSYEGDVMPSPMGGYDSLVSYHGEEDFHVVLVGENSLTNHSDKSGSICGLYSTSNMTISGEGSLNVLMSGAVTDYSDTFAILAGKDFVMESGTVVARSTRSGGYHSVGIRIWGDADIRGGSLTVHGVFRGADICHGGTIGANVKLFEATGDTAALGGLGYDMLIINHEGTGWTNTEGSEGEATIATGEYDIINDLNTYKKVRFYTPDPEPTPPGPTPPGPGPEPTPVDPTSNNGLPGWGIALIVVGGVLVTCCLAAVLFFLLKPSYVIDYTRKVVIRTVAIKKHDGQVLLLDTKLRKVRRNEVDVYKSKEEAEKALKK